MFFCRPGFSFCHRHLEGIYKPGTGFGRVDDIIYMQMFGRAVRISKLFAVLFYLYLKQFIRVFSLANQRHQVGAFAGEQAGV